MEPPDSLREHLAAIVEGSDDAIITKDLNSIIQSWNGSAERLFGYTAEEAIGRPITILIPDDRKQEEVDFIARLRRGERIHHFETIRQRKDGTLLPISLTVSPVRDSSGKIVAASKIARDISLQYQAAEQQRLLLSEMRHRVGNAFAVAGSLITVTARRVDSAGELARKMRDRLLALATAHKMVVTDPSGPAVDSTPLRELVSAILDPFAADAEQDLDIENIRVAPAAITPLALVLYELCTNAVKYGALAKAGGSITISAHRSGDKFIITWKEESALQSAPAAEIREGFGTQMCRGAVEDTLGGTFRRRFDADGMSATLEFDLATLEA